MSKSVCFLLVGFLSSSLAAAGRPVTPEDVRKSIELQWASIEDFRIECDQFVPDASGERKPGTTLSRYEFVSKKGGEKRFRASSGEFNGADLLEMEVREDGRQRFVFQIASDSGRIYEITTQPQKSWGHSWDGAKFAALWLFMPAGKPLSQHLEAGAKLEVKPDGETATLSFMHMGAEVICELSGRHDWLAMRVTHMTSRNPTRRVVDRFDRVDGRWYPSAGHFDAMGPKGIHPTPFRFAITKFRYNEHPDAKTFGIQDAPKGTLVFDESTNKKYRIGLANPKALPKPESSPVAPRPVVGEPLTVPDDAGTNSAARFIGIISAATLAFATLFTVSRRVSRRQPI